MNMLRWITGHPILSLLIITAVYGVVNLSNLGHWLGTEGGKASHEVSTGHEAAAPAVETENTVVEEGGAVEEQAAPAAADTPEAPAEAHSSDASAQAEPAGAVEGEAAVAESPAGDSVAATAAAEGEAPAAVDATETGAAAADEAVPVAAENKEAGGLFNKLFSGKPSAPADVAAGVAGAAATAAGKVADSVEKGAAAVAEPVAEVADKAAEVTEAKEKGSLFDFFKREKPEQEQTAAPAQAEASGAGAEQPAAEASVAAAPEAAPEAAAMSAPAEAAVAVTEITISMARQAFWNKDFAGATTIYEALIAKDGQNADLYGEYGNMLIQSGSLIKGIEAYDKAANLMIEQQRFEEVAPLIRFIGNYDRSKAMALVEKMPRR